MAAFPGYSLNRQYPQYQHIGKANFGKKCGIGPSLNIEVLLYNFVVKVHIRLLPFLFSFSILLQEF